MLILSNYIDFIPDDLFLTWYFQSSNGAPITIVLSPSISLLVFLFFSFFLPFLALKPSPEGSISTKLIWIWSFEPWVRIQGWFIWWSISLFSWHSQEYSPRLYSMLLLQNSTSTSVVCQVKYYCLYFSDICRYIKYTPQYLNILYTLVRTFTKSYSDAFHFSISIQHSCSLPICLMTRLLIYFFF